MPVATRIPLEALHVAAIPKADTDGPATDPTDTFVLTIHPPASPTRTV